MYDILDMTGIRVVRSGRRHKIGVAHIVAVMNSVDPIQVGDQSEFRKGQGDGEEDEN
ncbi:hypothetical protein [Jatrophihabitans sp. GAS493]|uniref:hypothetical protein n=1 Tax=Jatrophihabitans sp. GAS493 TaxID=1907575 RepID=UPI0012FE0665|nr:hypothetical protein [Jatrophihabitans sp. GAS493]